MKLTRQLYPEEVLRKLRPDQRAALERFAGAATIVADALPAALVIGAAVAGIEEPQLEAIG